MDLELDCYSEDEWEDNANLHTFPYTSAENESCVQNNAETNGDLILYSETGNLINSVSKISQWFEQSSNVVLTSEKVLEYINPLNENQNGYCTERGSEADTVLNHYLNRYAETQVDQTGSPEYGAEGNADIILSPEVGVSIFSNSEVPQLCIQSSHDDVTSNTVNKDSVLEYPNTQSPSQYSYQYPESGIRGNLSLVTLDHNYSKNWGKVYPLCRLDHDHTYCRLRGSSIINKMKSFHVVSFRDNQTISVMCAFCFKTFDGVDQFLGHVEVMCNTKDLSAVPYTFIDLVMDDSKVRYAHWFFCSLCMTVFCSLEQCRYHIRRCFTPQPNKWQNNLKLYLLPSCKGCGEKIIRTTRAGDVMDLDTKERLVKMTFSCKCHHSEHLMNPKRSQSFSLLSIWTAENLIPLCSSSVSSQCHDSNGMVNSNRNEGLAIISKSKAEDLISVRSCVVSSKCHDSKILVNSNIKGVSLLSKKRRAEFLIPVSTSVSSMGASTVKLTKRVLNSFSYPFVVYHSLKIDLEASIDLELDTYKCGFCDKQFSTVQSFDSHVRTCPHKKNGYRSPVCITFNSNTWPHVQQKSMCEYCISMFPTHKECLMHMDKCCFKTRNFPNIQFAALRLCEKCKRRQIKIPDRTTDMMEMIRAYSDSEQQDIPVCDISNIKSRCNQLCIKNSKTLTVQVENKSGELFANTNAGKVNQLETILGAKCAAGEEIDLETKSKTDTVSGHHKQQDEKKESHKCQVDDIKIMSEIHSLVTNKELPENAIGSVLHDEAMNKSHSDHCSTLSEDCDVGKQLSAVCFTRNLQTGPTCSGKSSTNCKSRYAFHQVNMTNQLFCCGYCQEYFRTEKFEDFLQHVNLCQKLNESIILPVQLTRPPNSKFMCGFCSQNFICVCFAISHMKQCALSFPVSLEGRFLNIKYRMLPYCKRHNMKRVSNIDKLDEDLRVFLQGRWYKSPRICECTESLYVVRDRNKTRTKRKRKSKKESWTCAICGEIFYNKFTFDIHGDVHSNKSKLCHICGKSDFKKLTKHLRNVHCINYRGDILRKKHRPYHKPINWESLCHVCGKLVNCRRNLQYHLRQSCARQKPYQCQYCGKMFSYKYSHALHIKRCVMKITYRK